VFKTYSYLKRGKKHRLAMLVELLEVKSVVKDHAHHTGAAISTGNLDSVHVGLNDAGEGRHNFDNLRGGNILTLPAEAVTNAVHEMHAPVGISRKEIAGADIAIEKNQASHFESK